MTRNTPRKYEESNVLLAVGVMCLTACAQKKGGERGPRMGGKLHVSYLFHIYFFLKTEKTGDAGHKEAANYLKVSGLHF